MTTALIKSPNDAGSLLPSQATLQTMLTLADQLYRSTLLPAHIKSGAAALAVIQNGLELGLPPMYALRKTAIVQGKPTIESEVMLALIYHHHGDEAVQWVRHDDQAAVLRYKRRGASEHREFSFTIEQAKAAGLTGKDTWKSYPGAMLRARCISAMARIAFPDVIAGLYTAEELGATVAVDATGAIEVVDVTPPAATGKQEPSETIDAHTGEITRSATPEQRKRLAAAAKASTWTRDDIVQAIKDLWDANTTGDLDGEQTERLIELLQDQWRMVADDEGRWSLELNDTPAVPEPVGAAAEADALPI